MDCHTKSVIVYTGNISVLRYRHCLYQQENFLYLYTYINVIQAGIIYTPVLLKNEISSIDVKSVMLLHEG